MTRKMFHLQLFGLWRVREGCQHPEACSILGLYNRRNLHLRRYVCISAALTPVLTSFFSGMFATLVSLYFVHKRQRNVEREKRMQYWREQNAFRQNIMQMQESARHSLMSLNGQSSPRSTVYGMNSEESQIPMLNAQSKSSALRHQFSDNDLNGSEESIVVKRKEQSRF